MFPQRWLPHWSNSLFLLSVFLGGFFCNGSFSQEPSSQDARTRSDKQGRIVGLTYWGQGGLHLKSGFAKMKGESGSLAVSAKKGQIDVAWWFLPLNHRNNPCDAKMTRVRMLVAAPP